MKCPSCGYNQKKKMGTTCGSCSYGFVFTGFDGMTDGRWLGLIEKTSAEGTYFFTENQLFATYCKKQQKPGWLKVPGCLLPGTVLTLVAAMVVSENSALTFGDAFWRFGALLGLFGLWLWSDLRSGSGSATAAQAGDSSHTDFRLKVAKWEGRRPTEKLLRSPQLETAPPEAQETDLYDYGVESVLIVDEDRLVDLLVLNNFHAQERCVVISRTGYPGYLVPRVRDVLEGRTDLPVFVLHNSSIEGQLLPHQAVDLDLGVVNHPVIDLGWNSRAAQQLGRLNFLRTAGWVQSIPVDLVPPRRLLPALATAMQQRLPLAAFLGAEQVAGAWTEDGDRHWVDSDDFG
ncbi:MAG: hypothetical protein VX498_15500 [Myxococcota bacterium]|nr:hypothetical protein [Myxococcota bacterium]